MIFKHELMELLREDAPFVDNTTFGLGINGVGRARFYPKKDEIILCGIDEAKTIALECALNIDKCAPNASKLKAREVALEISGDLNSIFKIAKTLQNLLEYASSIATYTHKLVSRAKSVNPNITILGTRKTAPFSKKLQLKALISGGGIVHRYGLSDSVLVFAEHAKCLSDKKAQITRLKNMFKEHKIIIEVSNAREAREFTELGADILQCERFSCDELRALSDLKRDFPQILLSATGDINLENVAQFAQTGIDMIVTSSPYRAQILDIKVEIKKDS